MKPWVADAKDIGIVSEDDVVITPSINRFTAPQGRDNMFFVVAPKGVGKTLFLKYKRHLYQKKHKKEYQQEEIYFIPHSDLVDRHVGTIQFNLEKIDILRNTENWVNLWTSCISLSIIKHLKLIYEKKGDRVKEDALKAHIGHLPNELRKMIDNPLFVTPFGYLSAILNLNYKSINKILKKQYLLTETIKKVRSAVAVFIDNVDECFGEHLRTEFDTKGTFRGEVSSDIWYGAQIGLMLAIWELSGYEHLKIFASIRKEAFLKLLETDDRGLQIKGSTSDIKYSKEELRGIFIKNIKSMDNSDLVYPDYRESDPIYSFLGLERNKITNAWVSKTKEDIFDYIYRHTLKRPRDLMIIGAELANIGVTERGEENIRAKVDEASSDISRTYMQEMKPHLDFERFEGIFNLIHSNILTRRELREICREFNKQKTCENKNCKQCEKTHAFCNLYKLAY